MPDTSGYKRDVIGAYIEKDPAAYLDYTVDWSDWLPQNSLLAQVSFTSSTVAGDTAPLVIESSFIVNGNQAVAMISGGTAGNIYIVTNTIETDNSEVDRRQFRIKVLDRQL